MEKRHLQIAGDEQASDILITHDVEWLVDNTHAPDLANEELELDKLLLRTIKTEHDPYHIDAEIHAVQGFTSVPQTDEYIKTELVLDEELIDNFNESETNCKQHVLSDHQLFGAGISDKKSETSYLPSHSDAPVRLRRGRKARAHRQPALKCEICLRAFKWQSDLNRHLRTHTKFKAYFVCEVCGSSFTQKESLKKHMSRKHLNKAQSITPQTTYDDSVNRNEILESTQTSQATFECEICSRSCKTQKTLAIHLNTHSKDRKPEFSCDLCEKTFYWKNGLLYHQKVHSFDSYPCTVCGHRFRTEKSLKVHMLRYEHFDKTLQITPQTSNDGGVPMKTELISDEEFIDEGNDRVSVSALAVDDDQRTRAVAARSVICEICQNSYPGDLIETHKRISHGDKPYQCEFCPRVCLDISSFEKHLSTHNDNRPRPYACEQCESKFLSKLSLKRHMKTKHNKNRKPEFNCKLCEKKFYTRTGLRGHMRIHTGETFGCEVCGAHYLRDDSLQMHILSKHAGKTQQLTPDSQTANDDSFQTKAELM